MIFLVEYERESGRLIELRRFADTQRVHADDARIECELTLNRLGIEREVVLLEAETEEALRRTHRRYFEDLKQLASTDL